MRIKHVAAAVAALLVAAAAGAQPYGMGPGMMGGYGMGSGMMGGRGPGGYGSGPGMMWGSTADAYAGLDLAPEQRRQIADIEQETSKAMWQFMGTMHDQDYRMHGVFGPGAFDEDAARKAYQVMTDTRKAMFELQLQARKKIDAVLTPEQRDRLRRTWGSR
jgi:Spy/CpxP family protein refolding chaperone